MNLPQNTPLGKLQLIEVYHYYDGPKPFSCRSNSGQIYLVFWLGDENNADNWMYVPISLNRFINARAGSISLYDVCKKSENDFVWILKASFQEDKHSAILIKLCADLKDDELPAKDSYLELDIQTLPAIEEMSPFVKEKVFFRT